MVLKWYNIGQKYRNIWFLLILAGIFFLFLTSSICNSFEHKKTVEDKIMHQDLPSLKVNDDSTFLAVLNRVLDNRDYIFLCGKDDLKIFILSIATLETGHFSSRLVKHNNFFGIKSKIKGQGKDFITREYENGELMTCVSEFMTFKTSYSGINQFLNLLSVGRYRPVREMRLIKDMCYQLQRCGYATDPKYADKLYSVYLRKRSIHRL